MAFAWGELFPSKTSFVVFVSYMALFINQGILVTATKDSHNNYAYNTITVVLLTELSKLIVAACVFLKSNSVSEFFTELRANATLLGFYLVPAFLYCLYNNLAFTNLASYDPTTYFLLLQFRVVVTGVVFQLVFDKKLSKTQWLSLLVLTVGCVIKEYGRLSSKTEVKTTASTTSLLDYHILLILLQVVCSCLAGVYNEKLMKDRACDVPLMIQNCYLYLDSVLCNVVFLSTRPPGLVASLTPSALSAVVLRPSVMVIVLNNALIGIVTSLFLKKLNSILKTFASAMELMFTAVLCWIIFGIPIDVYTFVAIGVVSAAIVVYARNPVVNLAKNELPAPTQSDTSGKT